MLLRPRIVIVLKGYLFYKLTVKEEVLMTILGTLFLLPSSQKNPTISEIMEMRWSGCDT